MTAADNARSCRFEHQRAGQGAAEDEAAHAFHHEERRADDAAVVAERDDGRHALVRRAQGGQQPALAEHIVGDARLHAERRPAQHELVAAGPHEVGEVREAAGKLLDVDGAHRPQRLGPPLTQRRADGLPRRTAAGRR